MRRGREVKDEYQTPRHSPRSRGRCAASVADPWLGASQGFRNGKQEYVLHQGLGLRSAAATSRFTRSTGTIGRKMMYEAPPVSGTGRFRGHYCPRNRSQSVRWARSLVRPDKGSEGVLQRPGEPPARRMAYLLSIQSITGIQASLKGSPGCFFVSRRPAFARCSRSASPMR